MDDDRPVKPDVMFINKDYDVGRIFLIVQNADSISLVCIIIECNTHPLSDARMITS